MAIFNIGVIGVGMLGSAILRNLDDLSEQNNLNVYCYNRALEKSKKFSKESKNVNHCDTLGELIDKSQYIFLAVNTESVLAVVNQIVNLTSKEIIIFSAEATTTLEELNTCFQGKKAFISRIMANTNIALRGSAIAYCFNKNLRNSSFKEQSEKLLSMLGFTISVKEEQLPSYTVIVGCLPSFIYMAIEAVQDAAVCGGLPLEEATDTLLETWIGALSRVKESKNQLTQIKHELYYPNGITIKGICALEKEGFRSSIIQSYLKNVVKVGKDLYYNKNIT